MSRFLVHSTLEVPLPIDATDPWHALRLGLELLERAEVLGRAVFDVKPGGMVLASDPLTNEHFAVVPDPRRLAA